jgi:endoglucanase
MKHAPAAISRRDLLKYMTVLGSTGGFAVARLGTAPPPSDAAGIMRRVKKAILGMIDKPAYVKMESLSTRGGALVNSSGDEVRLAGVSWFGMESGTFAPHGLDVRTWQSVLDQIVDAGFNLIRLGYSNQLLDPQSRPTSVNYALNPDLKGLNGLQVLDQIVRGAGVRGLRIVLDRHRPDPSRQSPLWYTASVPEAQWIRDWVHLAERYSDDPTVIGADLHNEPYNPATWGDGNLGTDWRLAAERAGNAILAANPNWLIFVEGIQRFKNTWANWGGNLTGARHYPVRLSRPDKLVYSAHDFGPSIAWQPWFEDPTFPTNLPSIWHQRWAYLRQEGIAPVWVGEFGARSVGQDVEGTWQRHLVAFLKDQGISYSYWALNPDSRDTGGLLENDWTTINRAKLDLLATYQASLLS